jgi:hypothetical protein
MVGRSLRGRQFASVGLSVVGGRPLSSGGQSLHTHAAMYAELWGVHGVEHSARLIRSQLLSAPKDAATVVLAHNGPSGLGAAAHDICGKDWGSAPADWGDDDLAAALGSVPTTGACVTTGASPMEAAAPHARTGTAQCEAAREEREEREKPELVHVPLVVFGHMHDGLQGGGTRTMVQPWVEK